MIIGTENVVKIILTLNEAEIFVRALNCAIDNDTEINRDYNDNEIAMLKELHYEVRQAT